MTANKILFATDFSHGAEIAELKATEFARALNAELHVVHAWTPPVIPSPFAMPDVSFNLTAAVQAAAEQSLKKEVDKLKAAGFNVHGLVQMGEPWRLIVETAKSIGATMIVMGTHGRHGLPRVLLGSVAEKVVRTAGCPVLTVPMTEARAAHESDGAR